MMRQTFDERARLLIQDADRNNEHEIADLARVLQNANTLPQALAENALNWLTARLNEAPAYPLAQQPLDYVQLCPLCQEPLADAPTFDDRSNHGLGMVHVHCMENQEDRP